jgi:hypothetical protein
MRHIVVRLGKALVAWRQLASLVTKPDVDIAPLKDNSPVNTSMAAVTNSEVGSNTSEIRYGLLKCLMVTDYLPTYLPN